MKNARGISLSLYAVALLLAKTASSQEVHDHPVPEKLGTVSFPTTCKPAVQKQFERSVALLHSFAYGPAAESFGRVAAADPSCAIAHWGSGMAHLHQLWDPPFLNDEFSLGEREIRRAQDLTEKSERERKFIDALALVYQQDIPYQTRIANYEAAMNQLAAAYRNDVEAQVFHALALLASASPFDETHTRQKQALAILEPLYGQYPQHPGIAHYLIHACDNSELAAHGLAAARAYSKIAPSAPHALHMPSHIFTRLGMWSDSIESNRLARTAARQQKDAGEELHAMDYLVYAYLQEGRDREAGDIVQQITHMRNLDERDFKIAYASTAMPVRYAIERRQWADAAAITPPDGAPAHVIAVAVWGRALGLARSGKGAEASAAIDQLHQLEQQLRASGINYWATQVAIQSREAEAWLAQFEGKSDEARDLLRKAADEEDAIEKLPVTPGPVVPAREQLGDLLLEQNEPKLAAKEFQIALANSPNRRAARNGLVRATELVASEQK